LEFLSIDLSAIGHWLLDQAMSTEYAMTQGTFRPYRRLRFDAARCTQCGECFRLCPVMQLRADRAQEAIEQLIDLACAPSWPPEHGSQIPGPLRSCTSCLACNQICAEDCRPANLILDLWHKAYLQEGLPARAAYFLPHSRPNFRTDILAHLPPDERLAVEHWEHGGPVQEFVYAGCNLITTPYLTFSRLFHGLEIRGSLDYCCGEMLFRMGLYEAVEQVARRLTHWFRRLGASRVYLVCTAGLNMLRNVLPQFGADFTGIEFVPFQRLVLERLRAGALGPVEPLDQTVTVQDSCHARTLEPGFANLPRDLLAALNVQVVEAPHSREDQICCGIGGGFAHASAYDPLRILLSARSASRDHRRTEADATCVYCSGCLEMLSVARYADPNRRPVYHLLELVQMAIGETPRRRQGALAAQFIAGTVRRQFPKLLSRERFWLPHLPEDPVEL
jgi:Fe-S oxidoreductase